MTFRDVATTAVIGLFAATTMVGGLWLILDAYERIAYALLGIPHG